MKEKIYSVVGPTASGKTALSIALAEAMGGEIISTDSMQIYRNMIIGTAAPTAEETHGIPHHLFGVIEPNVKFSVADYAPLAKEKIKEILSRGSVPILCGGTGLYLDGILNIGNYSEAVSNPKIREELEEYALKNGNDELHKMLEDIDPEAAAAIHKNNVRRVIRAIEIYKTTGITKSKSDMLARSENDYDCTIIYLNFADRNLLYSRIDKRVDKMFNDGLEQEVRILFENGMLKEDCPAFQAIGYKEFVPYFNKAIGLDEVRENIKTATRHYAKRQQTWFKRYKDTVVIYADCDGKLRKFEDIFTEAAEKIGINRG